jgi:hypothetical protein
MTINAQELFPSVEKEFSELVAEMVQHAEMLIDSVLQSWSTPEKLLSGGEVSVQDILTEHEKKRLGPEGVKLLIEHVVDGIVHLYQEHCWSVFVFDSPKCSSGSPEHWNQKVLMKYVPK